MALLEADVNYKVVKEFVAKVRERAVGADVMKSLTPGQMVVKIVVEEMTELLGGTASQLVLSGRIPNVIMLVGLQGSGKTTATAKLANLLRKQGKRPLMVACDVYRPAAIDQLEALGRELDIPVYRGEGDDPVAIAKAGVRHADRHAARPRHRRHRRPPARRRGDDERGGRDQGRRAARTRSSWSSTR